MAMTMMPARMARASRIVARGETAGTAMLRMAMTVLAATNDAAMVVAAAVRPPAHGL